MAIRCGTEGEIYFQLMHRVSLLKTIAIQILLEFQEEAMKLNLGVLLRGKGSISIEDRRGCVEVN